MPEEEWFTATDPEPMLTSLRGRSSERKLRLFAVACCQRMIQTVPVPESASRAVLAAERHADGNASLEVSYGPWEPCTKAAWHACLNCAETEAPLVMADSASANASWAMAEYGQSPPHHNALSPLFTARLAAVQAAQASLLRDIVGNPFRPVTFDPRWRSETVLALATGIYAERAFDRLPILADALEEAGCDHADILTHCRGPGPHARGCWVVDLVLNKS